MLGNKRSGSLFSGQQPKRDEQPAEDLRWSIPDETEPQQETAPEAIESQSQPAPFFHDGGIPEEAVEYIPAAAAPPPAAPKRPGRPGRPGPPAETTASPPPPPPPEASDEDDEDDAFRRGLSSGDAKLRTHSLFFSPSRGGAELGSVLEDVQEYISSKYSTLITDGGDEETKGQIKRYIQKYVQDRRIAVEGMDAQTLVDTLYTEMAEFGFLTKYIFGSTNVEEINVNSWKDCEVVYAGGRLEKLDEHFESPDHAINVMRRMLHISGIVLDNASPAVLGHLSKNIRIAVLKTPLVDEDVGISASIRIVNPQSMQKADFIRGGTATDPMMDFLAECLRYGISVCVAGATGSGKTTVAGWLLTTIPDYMRVFTIENGSRELDLVREKDGVVVNSVIHTLTRPSENERQNIDQEQLLDMALRFHPDVICVGEMRSYEAHAAQEAARTGHAVLTTIHSNSCDSTWRRMVTLCKRKYEMADDTYMDLVTEAFPIVVFAKQLEDKSRKIMEIMECAVLPDGKRQYNTIYRYQITENSRVDDRFVVEGHHESVSVISEGLKKRFLENGMPSETMDNLLAAMGAEKRKKEVKAG